MFRTRSRRPVDRRGMILLVVLALLTLFAIVGIAFVLSASDQATDSRIAREAVNRTTDEPPDAKAYVDVALVQLIYGIADGRRPAGCAATNWPGTCMGTTSA
jgi:hypothetical protein